MECETSFYILFMHKIINAVDEMHEINDWFGRSQNGIAESVKVYIKQFIHLYNRREEPAEKFQSCFNGCHKWMEKEIIYLIKIKVTTADETLTTCIRCAWSFDLISSINTTIYFTQYPPCAWLFIQVYE